jgi:hypothetical protein
MSKYYVTMTDSFMSGWGQAENKINKLVFECDTMKDALTVESNALARGDQKYVNIRSTKPSYSSSRYYTQFKNKEEYPKWYEENAF